VRHYRVLSIEEIQAIFPRAKDAVAGVAETSASGEIWRDCCFLLFADNVMALPAGDIDSGDLVTVIDMLHASARRHDEGHQGGTTG
jgi:hypothetical protein